MKKTINNVRVFDGEKLSSLTNVFIENGYISSIGNVVFEADKTIEDHHRYAQQRTDRGNSPLCP